MSEVICSEVLNARPKNKCLLNKRLGIAIFLSDLEWRINHILKNNVSDDASKIEDRHDFANKYSEFI